MSVVQEKFRRQMMVTGLKGPRQLAPLTSRPSRAAGLCGCPEPVIFKWYKGKRCSKCGLPPPAYPCVMNKKQIYSFELYDWVKEQVPKEIIQAMHETGWNPFGIYELVKEGLSLERKHNLTNQSSRPHRHILKFCPDCDNLWDECPCRREE